ncbi:MAG: type II toxin-antitoxin system HicB family antitoxin [Actinobacteria bacterium]|nr:type II toxin-antitoxin system HicB family antitoxin [Actinomycetota bacterium]
MVIHRDRESDALWAETPQLPGCFAVGETLGELIESLEEAVRLYIDDPDGPDLYVPDRIDSLQYYTLGADGTPTLRN